MTTLSASAQLPPDSPLNTRRDPRHTLLTSPAKYHMIGVKGDRHTLAASFCRNMTISELSSADVWCYNIHKRFLKNVINQWSGLECAMPYMSVLLRIPCVLKRLKLPSLGVIAVKANDVMSAVRLKNE